MQSKRGRWTAAEKQAFERALPKLGRNWKAISELIGSRTSFQVRSHAQKYLLKLKKAVTADSDEDKNSCSTGQTSSDNDPALLADLHSLSQTFLAGFKAAASSGVQQARPLSGLHSFSLLRADEAGVDSYLRLRQAARRDVDL